MSTIVVDTNHLVALIDPKDVWHAVANEIESCLPVHVTRVFVDVVLTEAASVFARRCEERKDVEAFPRLISLLKSRIPSSFITWISPQIPMLYEKCLKLMLESDGSLNFNDSLITLYMREQKLSYIASFDKDFDTVKGLKRCASPADAVKFFG
ncbi:MAG: type II toxin-antitoxin system VapC family toxin [Bacteroidota bacterium]